MLMVRDVPPWDLARIVTRYNPAVSESASVHATSTMFGSLLIADTVALEIGALCHVSL